VEVSSRHLAQVPLADLNIPILGQLSATQLPLGDALKPGRPEVVRLDAALRGRLPARSQPLASSGLRQSDGAVADPRATRSSDEKRYTRCAAATGRGAERAVKLRIALRA
jgi:hypothetical protein